MKPITSRRNRTVAVALAAAVLCCGVLTPAACAEPEEWLNALRQKDAQLRMRKAYAYEELEPVDVRTVRALLKGLTDVDSNVRRYCAGALGEIEVAPGMILPALVRALADEEQGVRDHAALALAKIGPPAIQPLINALAQSRPAFDINTGKRRAGKTKKSDLTAAHYAAAALAEMGEPAVSPLLSAYANASEGKKRYIEVVLALLDDKSSPALVRALGEGGRGLQLLALRLLDGGGGARAAVAPLAALLKDQDKELRLRAAEVLAQTSHGKQHLAALFDDEDVKVRLVALRALYNTEDLTDAALLRVLKDPNLEVQAFALRALPYRRKATGEAIAAALSMLRSPDPERRVEVIDALGEIGKGDQAVVNALLAASEDPDKDVRSSALGALRHVAPSDPRVVSLMLSDLAAMKDAYERAKVLRGLGESGSRDPAVLAALRRALSDPDATVRAGAAGGVGSMGADARELIPDLVKSLKSSSEPWALSSVESAVVEALAKMDADGVPALLSLLGDQKFGARTSALYALRKAADGSNRDQIITAFKEHVRDPNREVARVALESLAELREPSTLPVLMEMLSSQSAEARRQAVGLLKRYDVGAQGVLPALTSALDDKSEEVRLEAAAILAERGENREGVLRVASRSLTEMSWRTYSAEELFKKLGTSPVSALKTALREGKVEHRYRVLTMLARYDLRSEGLAPQLIELLKDAHPRVRSLAAKLLGTLGRDPAAEAALNPALRDKEEGVRDSAAEALVQMGADLRQLDPVFLAQTNDAFIAEHMGGLVKAVAAGARYGDLKSFISMLRGGGRGRRGALRLAMLRRSSTYGEPYGISDHVEGFAAADVTRASVQRRRLPWPPPAASAKDALPDSFLRATPTLNDTLKRLRGALELVGFDSFGLYDVPGGFALIPRVERINADGTSFQGPDRWTNHKLPTPVGWEFVRQSIRYKPGEWRMFVFVVTTDSSVGNGGRWLTEDHARRGHLDGESVLSKEVASASSKGRYCHVLVYHLRKKLGRGTHVIFDGSPGAFTHLQRANLWEHLR